MKSGQSPAWNVPGSIPAQSAAGQPGKPFPLGGKKIIQGRTLFISKSCFPLLLYLAQGSPLSGEQAFLDLLKPSKVFQQLSHSLTPPTLRLRN